MANQLDTLHVSRLTASTFTPPAGSVTNASVAAATGIEASKLEHQDTFEYRQAPGAAVVAATHDIAIVRGATGDVIAFEGVITGAIATGADRTVTVDLLRSTGGGAFATVLTSALVLDDDNTIRVKEAATINTSTLVAGDLLRLTVAVAGAAGNQAEGLLVTLTIRQDAAP